MQSTYANVILIRDYTTRISDIHPSFMIDAVFGHSFG